MKRKLNVNQLFKNFEGDYFKENGDKDGEKITLKAALFGYLRNSSKMGLTDQEQRYAYETGLVLSTATEKKPMVVLTTAEYNLLKKLADLGSIKHPNGETQILYPIELRFGVADAIDRAEVVEEKEEKEEKAE